MDETLKRVNRLRGQRIAWEPLLGFVFGEVLAHSARQLQQSREDAQRLLLPYRMTSATDVRSNQPGE
jgi:hypothetical protein